MIQLQLRDPSAWPPRRRWALCAAVGGALLGAGTVMQLMAWMRMPRIDAVVGQRLELQRLQRQARLLHDTHADRARSVARAIGPSLRHAAPPGAAGLATLLQHPDVAGLQAQRVQQQLRDDGLRVQAELVGRPRPIEILLHRLDAWPGLELEQQRLDAQADGRLRWQLSLRLAVDDSGAAGDPGVADRATAAVPPPRAVASAPRLAGRLQLGARAATLWQQGSSWSRRDCGDATACGGRP